MPRSLPAPRLAKKLPEGSCNWQPVSGTSLVTWEKGAHVDVREERLGQLVRRFTEATGAVRVEAFGAIYARYERVVVRYCRRLT